MSLISVSRPSTQPSKGKFFLMHGLGSDEQDMFGLAQVLDPAYEIVCLRAPWEYGPGFAWFEISFSATGIEANIDQLWASVDQVAELVAKEDPQTTVVGGFSQGSMMTAGLMARHANLFSTAVLMSGRAVDPASGSFPGRAFQAHGLLDDVVSFREGDQLRSDLTAMGERHQFHAYEMGHSVCQEEIDDLNAWLRA